MTHYEIVLANSFKRDLKAVKKQGKDLSKMQTVVDLLTEGKSLPERCRNHMLTGEYKGYNECHIEPDWLLIYIVENDILTLTLTRTGSHSELFN